MNETSRPLVDDEEEDDDIGTAAVVFGPTVNAIFAPAKAFDLLDRKPMASLWILFWILLAMIAVAFVNLEVTRQFTRVGMVESMVNRGQEIDAEQLSQMVQTMDRFAPLTAVVQNIFILLLVAIVAVVIWAGSSISGGSTKFSRATAVASVAAVVHPMLGTFYISLNWWLDPPEIRRLADIGDAVPTIGLDLLFGSSEMSFAMRSFLMRVDLFNLWWAVLVVIGCQRMLRLGRGAAITIALFIWLASAALSSLMASWGGAGG